MKENNRAYSKTPMTEYIVDGDKIYLKEAPPPRGESSAAAKSANRAKGSGESKPHPKQD